MSTSYHGFSYVYDKFMDNIPYIEWSHYLMQLFQQHSITKGTLVDLGCGTGTLSLLMEKNGFSILGIDNSSDMLTIAADKIKNNPNITLIQQDMRILELGSTFDGFFCLCDSLNYLLSSTDVFSTFCGIKKHLKPNGVFIFDLKTAYFYKEILGDQVFCDHQEDCSYTWENFYFEEDSVNQYDLTIFARQSDSDLFSRFTETHHQKAYPLEKITDLLTQAGLKFITAYDAFTFCAPHSESERIYVIAKNIEMEK